MIMVLFAIAEAQSLYCQLKCQLYCAGTKASTACVGLCLKNCMKPLPESLYFCCFGCVTSNCDDSTVFTFGMNTNIVLMPQAFFFYFTLIRLFVQEKLKIVLTLASTTAIKLMLVPNKYCFL